MADEDPERQIPPRLLLPSPYPREDCKTLLTIQGGPSAVRTGSKAFGAWWVLHWVHLQTARIAFVKKPSRGVPVFKTGFGHEELEAVAEVFQSGWLGPGPKVAEFEEAFARELGAPHAVAVNSGTAALHLVCLAMGLGPGDEVLVPAITFVATAHAPAFCGASIVFVDVDPKTCNLDPEDLRRKISPRSRAVIPVHYGGHPADMRNIWAEARKHGLRVIEDAAHACGSRYRDRPVGGLPDSFATCFSFNAVKNLSTGDGGMITTHRKDLAEKLRRLRWMGIDKDTFERSAGRLDPQQDPDTAAYEWFYEVTELGHRYIMNDITAALGLAQLRKLPGMQARRQELAGRYGEALGELQWLEVPREAPFMRSSWHLYVVKTPHREELRAHLRERGIASSVHYFPVHLHPYYHSPAATILPVAEQLWKELLTIPFHHNLENSEVERVLGAVRSFDCLTQKRNAV